MWVTAFAFIISKPVEETYKRGASISDMVIYARRHIHHIKGIFTLRACFGSIQLRVSVNLDHRWHVLEAFTLLQSGGTLVPLKPT
jgi:hypothetical protein